jgi:hypothetical protein
LFTGAAFQYDKEKKDLVLDISKEALEAAPVFQRDQLGKKQWSESVYRYYGLRPYWTETESGGETKAP